MEEIPPTVYLLFGNDDLAIAETLNGFREKLGDATTSAMNTHRFSGLDFDLENFETSLASYPFLAKRRLNIVSNAERILMGRNLEVNPEKQERLFDVLEGLPGSTAVVLIDHADYYEDIQTQARKTGKLKGKIKPYREISPLYIWASEHPAICYSKGFFLQRGQRFVDWIIDRCVDLGGEIERQAAQNLANWVAEDPYLALQELTKLLDYVDRKRPIQAADVERLTPYRGQEGIFALVDAIGQRKGKEAQERLHRLLQDQEMRSIFPMVVRQFRLLILTREALDLGSPPRDSLPPKTPDFVIQKVSSQARKFSLADLERIYHHLLWIDIGEKRSQVDKVVALDTLIAELCL